MILPGAIFGSFCAILYVYLLFFFWIVLCRVDIYFELDDTPYSSKNRIIQDICNSWIRFEREYGALDDFDLAVKKVMQVSVIASRVCS